jgi:hypothetical protein
MNVAAVNTLKKREKLASDLAAWSSGIAKACVAMGREIESRQGIGL